MMIIKPQELEAIQLTQLILYQINNSSIKKDLEEFLLQSLRDLIQDIKIQGIEFNIYQFIFNIYNYDNRPGPG